MVIQQTVVSEAGWLLITVGRSIGLILNGLCPVHLKRIHF